MIVKAPTKVIPIWYIEKWTKENAELDSPLWIFIDRLLKEWELDESKYS